LTNPLYELTDITEQESQRLREERRGPISAQSELRVKGITSGFPTMRPEP
jgi:hypothetical protein